MKAKIICTTCSIQLGELSKPVINERDIEHLKLSMNCHDEHGTIEVLVSEREET